MVNATKIITPLTGISHAEAISLMRANCATRVVISPPSKLPHYGGVARAGWLVVEESGYTGHEGGTGRADWWGCADD